MSGGRRWELRDWIDAGAALGIIAAMVLVAARVFLGDQILDFGFYTRPYSTSPYNGVILVLFLQAAVVALAATAIAFGVGLGLGLLLGLAKVTRLLSWQEAREGRTRGVLAALARRLGRRLAELYAEVIRGTPLFVQIVLVWSIFLVAVPRWDPAVLSLTAGIVAMTANTAGYQSEIFRAGLQAVPAGQIEAGRAVGMSPRQAARFILLPQALRLVLPPVTNEFIALFKSSSLLYWIGVSELTALSQGIARVTHVFEMSLILTAMYLLVTIPLGRFSAFLEKRYRMAGFGYDARRARAPMASR